MQKDECIVKKCQNKRHQGNFVGDLCSPCYQIITTGEVTYTDSFIGDMKRELDKKREEVLLMVGEVND